MTRLLNRLLGNMDPRVRPQESGTVLYADFYLFPPVDIFLIQIFSQLVVAFFNF